MCILYLVHTEKLIYEKPLKKIKTMLVPCSVFCEMAGGVAPPILNDQ